MKNLPGESGFAGQRSLQWFAVLALVVAFVAAINSFLIRDGFSEDEFYQVAFLNERLPYFFVQVLRLDQHPPFHFLQLKFWALFFSGDKGLLLNSIAWHLISCAAIFWVGRRWLGTTAAVLAVAFFALAPQVASAAVNLRMYAMIPALAVGCWWLNQRTLTSGAKGIWPWIALLLIQIALGYSHAIAIYFVAWIALAAAVQVYAEHGRAAAWRRWFTTQAGSALLLLPLAVSAVYRVSMPGQSESGGNADTGSLIEHLGGMVAGWGVQWPMGKPLGAVFFVLAIGFGLWNKRTRWVAIFLLIGPYAAAAVIGMLITPMFKTPVYSAMLVPFACLALAGGLQAASRAAIGTWGAITLLTIMGLAIFPAMSQLVSPGSTYKPIATELRNRAVPGDVVVIPKYYVYWAVLRYAVKPDWGSPLRVLPPLNEKWLSLTKKLGPNLTSTLKLVPETNQVVDSGITYVIGQDALAATRKAQRVWFIRRARYPDLPQLSDGFSESVVVAEFGKREVIQLILYEKSTVIGE